MKQIKILMLIAFLSFFGAANAQLTTIEEVVTFRWTGAGGDQFWNNPANWEILNTNIVLVADRPDFPNVTETPGDAVGDVFTQVHNVIIPAGLNNYPTLNTATPNVPAIIGTTITINDLVLEGAATLSLVNKTLIINGTLSGTGSLVGSVTSDISFEGKDKINLKRTAAEVDAFFPASPIYNTNNFEGPNPDVFPDVRGGYSLTASAPFSVFPIPTPVAGGGTNTQISTTGLADELTLTFGGVGALPVYSFSADFSVTNDEFLPINVGDPMLIDGTTPAPGSVVAAQDRVEVSLVNILVTLTDGSSFTYDADGSGEFIGFNTQVPIQSIVLTSGVALVGLRANGLIGYVTIDNVKFGGRLPVGTLNMSQTSNSTKSLETLSVNVVDAVSNIPGVILNNPINIHNNIYPQSGIINSSPTVSDRNLTLISNSTRTASVRSHTNTGSVIGTVNVQRYITNFDNALQEFRKKQWRFLGFPYSNTLTVGNITGITISYAAPTLMEFREFSADGALGNGNTRNSGYFTFNDANGQLAPLSGLAAWIYEEPNPTTGTLAIPKTLSSFGTLNETGAVVTKSLLYNLRGVPLDQVGWNLISNPFASTIDWSNNTAITKTSIEGTIYRWDPQAENWTTLNGVTGTPLNTVDQYIESGSSFFVKATAPGASVVFSQDAKVLGLESVLNQFRKNGTKLDIVQQAAGSTVSKTKTAGIRINASGPGNPIPSQAYLDLSQAETSEGFDAKFDARNMGRTSGANVAIQGAEQLEMTMQFDRPIAEAGKEKRYYPLNVSVPSAGKTKIELELEGNWNSLNTVYLIDKKEGKTTPLSGSKLSYEFNMVNTVENDRFTLAINHINVGNKSGIVSTDVRVMNNPVRSDVIDAIIAHPSAKAKSYSIVNGSGATLNRGSIQDNNSVQHQLGFGKSNANGVMYLRVDFENGDSKTVKFIKL